MNPTLFYNNNPSLKHPAWDSDSHFKYLAQKKVFKTKRSYERWVEKESFLPDNIDLSIQCLHDNMDSDKDLDRMLN